MSNHDRRLEIFRVWAPEQSILSKWAKPIMFSDLPFKEIDKLVTDEGEKDFMTAVIDSLDYKTAIIVDLAGSKSVEEGLYLAGLGFRPVPLYNGSCVSNPYSAANAYDCKVEQWESEVPKISGYPLANDTIGVSKALLKGTKVLEKISLRSDALPAFLLDSNRMVLNRGGYLPAIKQYEEFYDNRWSVFPQDFPSANFLLEHEIKNVVVFRDKVNEDLDHILLRYQEKGIKILSCGEDKNIKVYYVPRPSHFKALRYRINVLMGLKYNPAGGFGAIDLQQRSGG